MSPIAVAVPLTNSIAVASSSLATVDYDDQRGILQVEFLDRTLYQYIAVPRQTYEDLCRAESKGAHFNQHIRNRFAWGQTSAVLNVLRLTLMGGRPTSAGRRALQAFSRNPNLWSAPHRHLQHSTIA